MFKKILVAIDEGEPAACAMKKAVDLAVQLKARVVVLHVVDTAAALVPALGAIDDGELTRLRSVGKTLLDHALTAAEISTETRLIEGEPADTILAAARECEADLIVLGSDSRGRLSHFLLGSTADSVIRRASCPVVTVRAVRDQSAIPSRAAAIVSQVQGTYR